MCLRIIDWDPVWTEEDFDHSGTVRCRSYESAEVLPVRMQSSIDHSDNKAEFVRREIREPRDRRVGLRLARVFRTETRLPRRCWGHCYRWGLRWRSIPEKKSAGFVLLQTVAVAVVLLQGQLLAAVDWRVGAKTSFVGWACGCGKRLRRHPCRRRRRSPGTGPHAVTNPLVDVDSRS